MSRTRHKQWWGMWRTLLQLARSWKVKFFHQSECLLAELLLSRTWPAGVQTPRWSPLRWKSDCGCASYPDVPRPGVRQGTCKLAAVKVEEQ